MPCEILTTFKCRQSQSPSCQQVHHRRCQSLNDPRRTRSCSRRLPLVHRYRFPGIISMFARLWTAWLITHVDLGRFWQFTICLQTSGFIGVVLEDNISLLVLVISQGQQNDITLVDPHLLSHLASDVCLKHVVRMRLQCRFDVHTNLFEPSKQSASRRPLPNIFRTWAYSCPSSLNVSSRFSLSLNPCQSSSILNGSNDLLLVLSTSSVLSSYKLVSDLSTIPNPRYRICMNRAVRAQAVLSRSLSSSPPGAVVNQHHPCPVNIHLLIFLTGTFGVYHCRIWCGMRLRQCCSCLSILIELVAKDVVVMACHFCPPFLLTQDCAPTTCDAAERNVWNVRRTLSLVPEIFVSKHLHKTFKSCHDNNDSHKLRTTSLCRTNSRRPIEAARSFAAQFTTQNRHRTWNRLT